MMYRQEVSIMLDYNLVSSDSGGWNDLDVSIDAQSMRVMTNCGITD